MKNELAAGLLAFGAYVPRLRLQRGAVAAAHAWFNPGLRGLGKGERTMANWDEDVITMAVEAARDCLSEIDRSTIDTVALASTSAPNADRQNAVIVKEALNFPDEIGSYDMAGGLRAGTSQLIQAFERGGRTTLCIASEKRRARPGSENELLFGDASAALLVGPGEPIARYIGSHSVSLDFVDHFRATDRSFDYGWEGRWIRDEGYSKIIASTLNATLAKLRLQPGDIDHLIIPVTLRGVAEGIGRRAGIKAEAVSDTLAATVGDSGAAHASVMLVNTLEGAKPGERILVVGFGQGCDVIALEVTEAIEQLPRRRGISGWLNRRVSETNYLKYLAFNQLLDMDAGMRAEADFKQPLTALYRNRKAVLGLVGGRCTVTGTVQFPKSDISVNPNDRSVGTQEDYPLADRAARILTYTADNLTYSPDPPAFYGMIEFEGGGRMMAEFTDSDSEAIEVGRPMRMMFRIKSTDPLRGFTKYFWKAVPASE